MKSLFPILLLMSLYSLTFANNVLPIANITSSSGLFSGKTGETFTFSGSTSYDPDGGGINYYWWYVDGVLKNSGSTAFSFTYYPGIVGNGSTHRTFQLMLKVRDNEYTTKTKTVTVTIRADKRNYFVTDHLGNVRATVDQNGAVIGYDDFYPYGQVMPGRSSNTANANDIYKFTGHERDAELGLDYMLARNYDPEIGRFLSVDPLYNKYPALSPYMYVEGNPLRLIDPDGRASVNPPFRFGATVETVKNAFSEGGLMAGMTEALKLVHDTVSSIAHDNPDIGLDPNPMSATGKLAVKMGVGLLSKTGKMVGESSTYVNKTVGKSIRNVGTNVKKGDFVSNLKKQGFEANTSKDGKATVLNKEGRTYSVRDKADSHSGPTANVKLKDGSNMKIRLQKDE